MARDARHSGKAPIPVLVGDGRRTFQADLFLPREPWAAVVFAGERAEGFGAAMLDALIAMRLAVLIPFFLPEDVAGDLRKIRSCCRWLSEESWTSGLAQGLFGSGELAAPVLRMAALNPASLQAVVVYEGSADMSEADLEEVRVPSLFIADSDNPLDAELHEAVASMLHCESRMILLDKALMPAASAVDWYTDHFRQYYKSPSELPHLVRTFGLTHGVPPSLPR
jgi:hypothetical protein